MTRSGETPSDRRPPRRTTPAARGPQPDRRSSRRRARSPAQRRAQPCPGRAQHAGDATAATPPTTPCPSQSPSPLRPAASHPTTTPAPRRLRLPRPASPARYPSPTECLSARVSVALDKRQNPLRNGHCRASTQRVAQQDHEMSRLADLRAELPLKDGVAQVVFLAP